MTFKYKLSEHYSKIPQIFARFPSSLQQGAPVEKPKGPLEALRPKLQVSSLLLFPSHSYHAWSLLLLFLLPCFFHTFGSCNSMLLVKKKGFIFCSCVLAHVTPAIKNTAVCLCFYQCRRYLCWKKILTTLCTCSEIFFCLCTQMEAMLLLRTWTQAEFTGCRLFLYPLELSSPASVVVQYKAMRNSTYYTWAC